MNLKHMLAEQKIDIPDNVDKPTTFYVDCMQTYCKEQRPPDDNKPLRVDIPTAIYAEWKCRNCLWTGHVGTKPAPEEAVNDAPVAAPKAPVSLPAEAVAFLAAKGMTEEEAIKYKLAFDGRRRAIKIPYIDDGKIVNHCYVPIDNRATSLENPAKSTFFGIAQLGKNSEPVIIAQSEIDAIVIKERGFVNVIGLPNGGEVAPQADEFNREPDKFSYLSAASDAAAGWHKVVFAFEDTTKALALRQELSRRLGPGRCASIKLTEPTVCETYTKRGADCLCEDINEAKPLPIAGLFQISDFEGLLISYFEHGMDAGVPTGWANLDKLYSVVPGQLTVVTGIPNSGKSEWVDALSMNLAMNNGWRFAAFSPENGKEMHTVKLVEKRVQFSADPKSSHRMSKDTFMSGAQWVGEHYCFIENTNEMPTLDWILDRAKDAALRYGIKGLIIDPWNRIEKKLGERQSETDYVAESIPKILRFLVNYGVHGWLVVHPKQQQPDHKTGKIRAPSLYDMAGSAHFVNMCDNGVVIHRSESMDDTTEVLVRKVRFKHVGRRGETRLRYNRVTGRYDPLDDELTEKQLDDAARYKAASNGDDDALRTWEPE